MPSPGLVKMYEDRGDTREEAEESAEREEYRQNAVAREAEKPGSQFYSVRNEPVDPDTRMAAAIYADMFTGNRAPDHKLTEPELAALRRVSTSDNPAVASWARGQLSGQPDRNPEGAPDVTEGSDLPTQEFGAWDYAKYGGARGFVQPDQAGMAAALNPVGHAGDVMSGKVDPVMEMALSRSRDSYDRARAHLAAERLRSAFNSIPSESVRGAQAVLGNTRKAATEQRARQDAALLLNAAAAHAATAHPAAVPPHLAAHQVLEAARQFQVQQMIQQMAASQVTPEEKSKLDATAGSPHGAD